MISGSKRLANLLIDSLCYFILVLMIIYLTGSRIAREELYWILIGIYYLYYLLCEYFFGQTMGKIVTKTRVVAFDGKRPSFMKILIRTILRMLPFDFVSYLVYSQGIHDTYSKTKLITTKNIL